MLLEPTREQVPLLEHRRFDRPVKRLEMSRKKAMPKIQTPMPKQTGSRPVARGRCATTSAREHRPKRTDSPSTIYSTPRPGPHYKIKSRSRPSRRVGLVYMHPCKKTIKHAVLEDWSGSIKDRCDLSEPTSGLNRKELHQRPSWRQPRAHSRTQLYQASTELVAIPEEAWGRFPAAISFVLTAWTSLTTGVALVYCRWPRLFCSRKRCRS